MACSALSRHAQFIVAPTGRTMEAADFVRGIRGGRGGVLEGDLRRLPREQEAGRAV